jgi:hypothetical protein
MRARDIQKPYLALYAKAKTRLSILNKTGALSMTIGQRIRNVFSSVFHRHKQAEDKTGWPFYMTTGTTREYQKHLEREQKAEAAANALRRDAGRQGPWQNPQPTRGRHW